MSLLTWLDLYFGPPKLQDEGVDVPLRTLVSFEGTGVTVADDVPNGRTKVTIPGVSGSIPTGTGPRTVASGVETVRALDLSVSTDIAGVAPYVRLPAQLGQFHTARLVATGNIALTGVGQTIDGRVVAVNDRIFAAGQTTTSQIGIYIAQAGAWVYAGDWSTYSLFCGSWITIADGTAWKNATWVITNASPIIVGTTAVTLARLFIYTPSSIFRTGAAADTDASALGTTLPRPTDTGYSYSTTDMQWRIVAGGTSNVASFEAYNTSAGGSLTTGCALKAPGGAHSITAWQGNAVCEQVGPASSCLLFSSLDGAGLNRLTMGRFYRSGAWCCGDGATNSTSALAQAGLTGPLFNITKTTGGALTSAADQALVYNVAGVAHIQGHAGARTVVGTATIVDTTATLHDVRTTLGLGLHTQAMADAPQTVSAANSTKNLIVATGANTAVRALTLTVAPTAGVMKIVRNNCTAFGITVQFSTGTATATIPPGTSAVVYGDGTNAVILMSGT